jgi:serine/threonine protein kinase
MTIEHAYADAQAESLLADLVDEITQRLNAGESVSLDEYATRHPQFSETLASLFEALTLVRQAGGADDDFQIDENSEPHGQLGDFRIVREIGRGGMGIVYEAEQISLGRRVALKVLPFVATLSPAQLQRFKNEARSAAALKHPNIVGVYSIGCERGVHYYAMEYVEGPSLAEVVEVRAESKEHGAKSSEVEQQSSSTSTTPLLHSTSSDNSYSTTPLLHYRSSADTAPFAALSTLKTTQPAEFFRSIARLGIQAAEALDYAHQMGVVHRDIKPSNLLLECSHLAPRDEASVSGSRDSKTHHAERDVYTPKLWITDFGLALTQSDAGLTMTGDLLGTLRYMSPEQAAGKRLPLDHRTDVYSLGITLYELLAGRPAFDSSERAELLRAIAETEPATLRKLVPSMPADLETIVHKAIEKDAADRYGSAGDLAADLRCYLEHRPIIARPPSITSRARKWVRRNMAVVAAAVGVLLLAVLGLSVSVMMLNAEKNKAQANLRVAANAVDQLLAEMGREAGAYGQLPQAERILDQAARFYQQLIEKSNDPAILLRAAIAHNHIGWLYRVLGRHELAIQKYHTALSLLSLVDNRQAFATEILTTRAAAYDGIGAAYMKRFSRTHYVAAETYLAQARAIWEHLVDSHPGNIGYVDGLVGTLNSQAVIYMEDRERLHEAEATYRQILELRQQLPQHRQTPDHLNTVAGVTCNLGTLTVERGRLAEAEPLFREAISMQEKVVALKPGFSPYADDLYKFRWNLVDLLVRQGNHAEASAAAEQLLKQFPNWLQAHFEAADLLLRCAELADRGLAGHHRGDGRAESAEQNVPVPLSGDTAQRYRAAARHLIAISEHATDRNPEALGFFAWFLLTCRDKSFCDPARALALAEAGLAESPRHELLHQVRGMALYRLGQYQAAIDAIGQSAAPTGKTDVVGTLFLAMSHWQLGNQKEAKEWYARGVDWFDNQQPKRRSVYEIFSAVHGELLVEAKELLAINEIETAEQK